MNIERFGLYLVLTNPITSYEQCAEAAVDERIRYVQLRMKSYAPREKILETARSLRSITSGSSTFLIIDDDAEIASECGADGVHLGQSDMPVAEARARFPDLRIIGLSTHSPEQAKAAAALKPDYCGVGPVYATPTKAIPDPVLGPELAGKIIQAAPFTTVAIGGVNAETLPVVLKAGAINFAVVRPVCLSKNPRDAIRRLQDAWGEAQA